MFSIRVITEKPIQAQRVITDIDILKGTPASVILKQIASVSSGSLLEIQVLSSPLNEELTQTSNLLNENP